MMNKILCAVDDTEHAKNAIIVATELSKAANAELMLLAVNPLTGGYGRGGISTFAWTGEQVDRLLASAAATAREHGAAGAKVRSVKSRDVARAIVIFAEDNDIDHIVVGTGEKGGLTQLMLGSVSRDVVSRAHCPVTVAR